MSKLKKTYLIDFLINENDFRTVELKDKHDAMIVADILSNIFKLGEIKFLKLRFRYDKIDDDVECTF